MDVARPQKIGLDYFPLDTDIDQDDKVAIIEAQHGMLGFSVVIKLLMKIYSEGYYYDWTEKEQILFSKRVNVDINQVNVIINDCVKWGLFDEKLFNKHKILTSSGIQRRYFEAVKRRQRVEIAKEFLLLDDEIVNVYSNLTIVSINDDINERVEVVNADINPQSKVDNSKVNESKVNDSNNTAATDSKRKILVTDTDADSVQQDIDSVARVGADPTKQDNSVSRIERCYLSEIRKRSMCSSKDMSDMVEVYETYKNLEFILSVMRTAAKENVARNNGRLTINSFSYFIPILQEEWDKLKVQKEGAKNGPTAGDSKQSIGFDKSKFLYQG